MTVFFICFRECLETVIIVSVLFAFLKQTIGPERDPVVYKSLRKQVWVGIASGLVICVCVGAGMIGAFYGFGKDHFSGTEDIWEGAFSLLATIIISLVGAALLRVSKLQDKWRVKLAQALEKQDLNASKASATSRFKIWCEKYAMFLLPFITVLREGLEAVVFIGGVGLSLPATAFPLAVFCGLLAGIAVGYLIYRYVQQHLDLWPIVLMIIQRRHHCQTPDLPDHFNMLPLPRSCRYLLTPSSMKVRWS